jgi:hypothetical protein
VIGGKPDAILSDLDMNLGRKTDTLEQLVYLSRGAGDSAEQWLLGGC